MSNGRSRAPGRVTVSLDGSERVVVEMAGEFDISNAEDLRAQLSKAAETGRSILIDAHAIGFADSSVIAALLRCVHAFGPIDIRNPSLTFRRIVETSGLTAELRIIE